GQLLEAPMLRGQFSTDLLRTNPPGQERRQEVSQRPEIAVAGQEARNLPRQRNRGVHRQARVPAEVGRRGPLPALTPPAPGPSFGPRPPGAPGPRPGADPRRGGKTNQPPPGPGPPQSPPAGKRPGVGTPLIRTGVPDPPLDRSHEPPARPSPNHLIRS